MSELSSREQAKQDRRAEQTGTYLAGLEKAPLHKRPGYRAAVSAAVEAGLISEEEKDRRFSGEHHEELTAESTPPAREHVTQDRAVEESQRAWDETLGQIPEAESSPVDSQTELPLK